MSRVEGMKGWVCFCCCFGGVFFFWGGGGVVVVWGFLVKGMKLFGGGFFWFCLFVFWGVFLLSFSGINDK